MFGGDGMTAQEKWTTTIRYMQLVRANYMLLKRDGRVKTGARQRNQKLTKWLEVIESVFRQLRRREGKSLARARKDWLISRTIEIMVFRGEANLNMRTDLAGPRPLNRSYVDALAEEAIRAVEEQAEKMGLLG